MIKVDFSRFEKKSLHFFYFFLLIIESLTHQWFFKQKLVNFDSGRIRLKKRDLKDDDTNRDVHQSDVFE